MHLESRPSTRIGTYTDENTVTSFTCPSVRAVGAPRHRRPFVQSSATVNRIAAGRCWSVNRADLQEPPRRSARVLLFPAACREQRFASADALLR